MGINISDFQVRKVGFGEVSQLPQALPWLVNPRSVWLRATPLPLTTITPLRSGVVLFQGGFLQCVWAAGVTGEDGTGSWADEQNR